MADSRPLPTHFYERDPEEVAKGLLGNILVRKLEAETLSGLIVETEAYYGSEDPASRAYHGMKDYNRPMWMEPGKTFIYNVHRYWMLNVVAHERSKVGAVLIRAIEPTRGIEVMRRNRKVRKLSDLTNGPGKLSIALAIDKRQNGVPVTSSGSEIMIAANEIDFEMGASHRIGVTKDLVRKLRFFIKGNGFVSRKAKVTPFVRKTRGACGRCR